MNKHGYAIVEFTSPEHQKILDAHHRASMSFFAQDEKEKQSCLLEANQFRYGYFARHDLGKELFQTRMTPPDAKWPSAPVDFHER